MSVELVGYDVNDKRVALPLPVAYDMYMGDYGVNVWFSLKFAERVSGKLVRVDVKKENGNVCPCFVDSLEWILDRYGGYCCVKVVSTRSRVRQNLVEPAEYVNYSTESMLEQYAKPFGIEKTCFPIKNMQAPLFYVELGMTAWDVIALFFRKVYDVFPMLNERGELGALFKPPVPVIFGPSGFKYVYLKKSDERSLLTSRVYMGDGDGSLEFSAYSDNVFAKECGITRVRYYKAPKQWSILPKRGAMCVIRDGNVKRFEYTVVVPEFVDVYPGMIVKVEGVDEREDDYYVQRAQFSKTEKGDITNVVLRSTLAM